MNKDVDYDEQKAERVGMMVHIFWARIMSKQIQGALLTALLRIGRRATIRCQLAIHAWHCYFVQINYLIGSLELILVFLCFFGFFLGKQILDSCPKVAQLDIS